MKRMAWVRVAAMAAGVSGMAWGQTTGEPPAKASVPASLPAAKAASSEVADLLAGGRQALQGERWTEASALFEKVLRLDAANQDAMFGLGAAYIQLEKYGEALPLLQTLNRQLPQNPMVKNNLAWVYLKSKDPAVKNAGKAIRLARDAVLDVPADYSIWNTLAEAYYANGQFDRALRAAQSALRLSQLAGTTNAASSRELVARCRKAAGAAAVDESMNDE